MISHKYKCIFIEIPKNASTSIMLNISDKLTPHPITKHKLNHEHLTYQELIDKYNIDKLKSYISFAVVRNPYDKILSSYLYTKHINKNNYSSLDEIINILYQQGTNFGKNMTIPQYNYLSLNNNIIVNHILKFETLQTDWQKLSNILNNNHNNKPIPNTLKHLNINNSKNISWQNYYDKYTHPSTREKIYQLYKIDFDTFNYNKNF